MLTYYISEMEVLNKGNLTKELKFDVKQNVGLSKELKQYLKLMFMSNELVIYCSHDQTIQWLPLRIFIGVSRLLAFASCLRLFIHDTAAHHVTARFGVRLNRTVHGAVRITSLSCVAVRFKCLNRTATQKLSRTAPHRTV